MQTSDFLFPRELERAPVELRKAIIIGSCLSELFVQRLKASIYGTHVDYILFNGAWDLPARSTEEISEYQYQYIQIPIRSVLTDAATRVADFDRTDGAASLLDIGKQTIDIMIDKALKYNKDFGLLTFVCNFIVPQHYLATSLKEASLDADISQIVRSLNDYLARLVAPMRDVFVADMEMIAAALGKRYFLDDSISFSMHGSIIRPEWQELHAARIEPLPPIDILYENKNDEFFEAVFRQIEVLYRVARQVDPVKLVVFDLDDTLWRGQLVEDYRPDGKPRLDGTMLGVWDAINQLRWRGIIVAICSKNDHEVVEARWAQAVDPPFVTLEDFTVKKINWNSKADNICEMLSELSLTAKSVVFVDDHPLERASVKAALPDIRVIGSNPFALKRILCWSAETTPAYRSQESKNRESMYRGQIARQKVEASMGRDDFLKSLATTATIAQIDDANDPLLSRAIELTNKTNQFNTNGIRWSFDQIKLFLSESGRIYAFSVKDRFADYGIVGVVYVRDNRIMQFVMSCRILGMDIEIAVLASIVDVLRTDGCSEIRADIAETESNMPCRTVYRRAGFAAGADSGVFILGGDASVARAPSVTVTMRHAEARVH